MNILGPPPSEVKHDRQLLQMEEQQISLCLRSAGPNTFMFIIINRCILDFAFLQGSVCSFVFVFVFSSMQIIPLDLSLADCYK